MAGRVLRDEEQEEEGDVSLRIMISAGDCRRTERGLEGGERCLGGIEAGFRED